MRLPIYFHLTLAGLLLASEAVLAQQSSPAQPSGVPQALPSPTINSVMADRPQTEEAQKLAPIAPPPIATASDKLPVDKLKVPQGFKLEVYASGMVTDNGLRFSPPLGDFAARRVRSGGGAGRAATRDVCCVPW
jgi:hypothetical protein